MSDLSKMQKAKNQTRETLLDSNGRNMELLTQTNLQDQTAHRQPTPVPNPIPFSHLVHLRNCYA
jgi:hypothetical protein